MIERTEWRNGQHLVHLALTLSPLPVGEARIPLGPAPKLDAVVRYLTGICDTVADLTLTEASVTSPQRTVYGDSRSTVHYSVTRPGAALLDVVSAATELDTFLDGMVKDDNLEVAGRKHDLHPTVDLL